MTPWLLRWLRRLWNPEDQVSLAWLADHDRTSARVSDDRLRWKWPVQW